MINKKVECDTFFKLAIFYTAKNGKKKLRKSMIQ